MVSRIVAPPKRPAPTPAERSETAAPLAPAPASPELRVQKKSPALASPITRRAILLGLLLIPINVYWVMMIEGVWHGLHFTCLSLAMNVVFFLLALMAGNAIATRWWPARSFSQAELLTVFG